MRYEDQNGETITQPPQNWERPVIEGEGQERDIESAATNPDLLPPPQIREEEEKLVDNQYDNLHVPPHHPYGPSDSSNIRGSKLMESAKLGFMRKVFALLGIHLGITLIACAISIYVPKVAIFQQTTAWLYWTVLVLMIITMVVILVGNKVLRHVPYNYMLMFVFVAEMSYLVSTITSVYDPSTVMLAITTCFGICVALMFLAMTIREETLIICTFGSVILMVPMMVCLLFFMFTNIAIATTLYCLLGTILYGIYLVVDLRIIMDAGSSKYSISFDDYVIASLLLYIDIVMMFLYILSFFGKK